MNSLSQRTVTGLSALIIAAMVVVLNFVQIPGLWTLTILVPGLAILYLANSQEEVSVSSLSLGAATTTTGLILLGQSLTGRWESWSYMWAMYPIASGLVMMYVGNRNLQQALTKSGQGLLVLGVILLATFGIFFEVFIFQSRGLDYINLVIGIILAFIGGYYLLTTENEKSKRSE